MFGETSPLSIPSQGKSGEGWAWGQRPHPVKKSSYRNLYKQIKMDWPTEATKGRAYEAEKPNPW